MLAVHDLAIEAYGKLIFELALEHTEEATFYDPYFLGLNSAKSVSNSGIVF
jgi:hypothetical protein